MEMVTGKYAAFVDIEGENIKLTFIGEGITAICYKGEDYRIYKEFFPQQSNGNYYYLRNPKTGELEESPGLSKKDKEYLDLKYKKFKQMKNPIESIYEMQAKENRTPVITWEEKKSESGKVWFKSSFTAGDTLKEKYQELDKEKNLIIRLKKELEYIHYVLVDLEIYHQARYLNMDIKPENLWCVTINETDKVDAIRNLDFGACVSLDDIIRQDNTLMDLECTPEYYNYKFINQILQCSKSEEEKKRNLKLLDVKATMKMLAKRVCGCYKEQASRDWFLNNIYNQYFLGDENCFEKYALAYSLASLLSGNNLDKPFGGIDVETNKARIKGLLDIIDYLIDENNFSKASLTCSELKKFNPLLENKDIYEAFQVDGRWVSPESALAALAMSDFSRELTPRIKLQEEEYRTEQELSIISLFLHCLQSNVKDLLFYGEGGMGKTQNLKALKIYLLKKGEAFYSRELKTVLEGTIDDFAREIETLSPLEEMVVILDGYDELDSSVKDQVDKIICEKLKEKCKLLIIGSRISSAQSENCSNLQQSLFSSFEEAEICLFTKEEILALIKQDSQTELEYLSLLQNTMFLRMHFELEKFKTEPDKHQEIKTEPEFIEQYLLALFREKGMIEFPSARLYHLGEFIHKQRRGKGRLVEEIPAPLKYILYYDKTSYVEKEKTQQKDIFYYNKRFLKKKKLYQEFILNATQVKYLNYLHAFYIVKQLELIAVEEIKYESETSIQRLFDIPTTKMTSESFYYAGQLLCDHPQKKNIFTVLNGEELKQKLRYENVLCLFLGAYKGVAKDIKGVFTFYHPIMKGSYDYLYVCDYIKELKADSIQDVQFLYHGLPSLKKIDINNDIYYSKGNCLIKRCSGKFGELYLGCGASKIPENVYFIHSYAFSHCDMQKIVIPNAVIEIDYYAFCYCEKLEDVILGKGLERLRPAAFYKCSGIKTLHIQNKSMEVSKEAYNLDAFVRIPRLERVIIPTTAMSYIYKMMENDKKRGYNQTVKNSGYALKYLEFFQGEERGRPYALTFEEIRGENSFRELHLKCDIKEVSKTAFGYLINNFEKITVEKACVRFEAKDNCLIDKKEQVLLLGCKNSIIPQGKVRHIGDYAFAHCKFLRRIVIPRGVESIGKSAFVYCNKLEKVQLPKSLKRIADDAFGMPDQCLGRQKRTHALKEVIIEDSTAWAQILFHYRSSNPIYYAKRLKCDDIKDGELVLREGITKISSGVFYNARNLISVDIPVTVMEIGRHAFSGCNIKTVNIHQLGAWGNINFKSFDANPCWNGAKLLINGKEEKCLIFQPNTTLKKFSFVKVSNVKRIELYEGCIVEELAFEQCTCLQEVIVHSPNVSINPTAFKSGNVHIQFNGTEDEWSEVTKGCEMEGVTEVIYNT